MYFVVLKMRPGRSTEMPSPAGPLFWGKSGPGPFVSGAPERPSSFLLILLRCGGRTSLERNGLWGRGSSLPGSALPDSGQVRKKSFLLFKSSDSSVSFP